MIISRSSPFLDPARKGRKEAGIGEALTAKPIGGAEIILHVSPASSRPPLCTSPGTGRDPVYHFNSLSPTLAVISILSRKSTANRPNPGRR